MKVKSLGTHMTEITIGENRILVSYETPVAVIHPIETKYGSTLRAVRTEKFHSITTNKHINQWFFENEIKLENVFTMSQEYFDDLLN